MSSVGEQFPIEQARCREVLATYKQIGPAGTFGVAIIADVLRRADAALASGDVVEILRAFQLMKDISE